MRRSVGLICAVLLVATGLATSSSAATAGVGAHVMGQVSRQSCLNQVFRGPAMAANARSGSALGAVRRVFGALRRQAASSDTYTAQPDLAALLGNAGVSTFDSSDVRQLTSSDGDEVYLVPVRLRPIVASAACGQLPGIHALIRLQRAQHGSGPGVCVVTARGGSSGADNGHASCAGAAALDSYYGAARILADTDGGSYALVPDGVSSVTIDFLDDAAKKGTGSSNIVELPQTGDVDVSGMSLARARATLESELPSEITEANAGGRVIAQHSRPAGAVALYLLAEGFVTSPPKPKPKPKPQPKPKPPTTTTGPTRTPTTGTRTGPPTRPTKHGAPTRAPINAVQASCSPRGVCTSVFRSTTCQAGSTASLSRCTTVTETTVCTAEHRCHTAVTTATTTTSREHRS